MTVPLHTEVLCRLKNCVKTKEARKADVHVEEIDMGGCRLKSLRFLSIAS